MTTLGSIYKYQGRNHVKNKRKKKNTSMLNGMLSLVTLSRAVTMTQHTEHVRKIVGIMIFYIKKMGKK